MCAGLGAKGIGTEYYYPDKRAKARRVFSHPHSRYPPFKRVLYPFR